MSQQASTVPVPAVRRPRLSRARRRQRSTRALVATLLLVLAAGLVVGATLRGDAVWLSCAAAATVLLGAAGVRIVWGEVLTTRRAASRDRARQTERHAAEATARSADHTAVVVALTRRLDQSRRELTGLREELAEARRLALSQRQRAAALRAEVVSLQDALVEQRALDGDELASWQGEQLEPVVSLAAWGGRRQA